MAIDESVELAPGVGVWRWIIWTVLLLLRDGISNVSSNRLFEKNVLRDAVIGVDGVLGINRDGGGLKSLPLEPDSGNQESLPTVGIFKGPRLMGGRLSGCKLFLCDGVGGFSSSVLVLGK